MQFSLEAITQKKNPVLLELQAILHFQLHNVLLTAFVVVMVLKSQKVGNKVFRCLFQKCDSSDKLPVRRTLKVQRFSLLPLTPSNQHLCCKK